MKCLLPILLVCAAMNAPGERGAAGAPPPRVKAWYTRLPFADHGFTGKYADIVVDLPQQGQFVFCRWKKQKDRGAFFRSRFFTRHNVSSTCPKREEAVARSR